MAVDLHGAQGPCEHRVAPSASREEVRNLVAPLWQVGTRKGFFSVRRAYTAGAKYRPQSSKGGPAACRVLTRVGCYWSAAINTFRDSRSSQLADPTCKCGPHQRGARRRKR